MRYHFTLTRSVITKNTAANVGKDMEKLEFSYISDRIVKWYSYTTLEIGLADPQILIHRDTILLINSISPYPKERTHNAYTTNHTWIFMSALFMRAKMWTQDQCPLTEEMISKVV